MITKENYLDKVTDEKAKELADKTGSKVIVDGHQMVKDIINDFDESDLDDNLRKVMENHLKGINKLLNDDTPKKKKPTSKKKTPKKNEDVVKYLIDDQFLSNNLMQEDYEVADSPKEAVLKYLKGKTEKKVKLKKGKGDDINIKATPVIFKPDGIKYFHPNKRAVWFLAEFVNESEKPMPNKKEYDKDRTKLASDFFFTNNIIRDDDGEFVSAEIEPFKKDIADEIVVGTNQVTFFKNGEVVDKIQNISMDSNAELISLIDDRLEPTTKKRAKRNQKPSQKRKPAAKKKTASKKQSKPKKKVNKAVNKTAINHYSESFKLLRRLRNFLRKDVVSFRQIQLLYMAYSKAAIEKKLDQNDTYYDLYKKANDVVVKMYKVADEKKDSYKDTGFNVVDTESNIYKKIDDLINSKKIDIGVRLTKRFVNIQGTSPDKARAKRLLKSIENAIDKDNIKEGNRLFDEVKKARKELKDYIKNDDPIEVTKYSVKKKSS